MLVWLFTKPIEDFLHQFIIDPMICSVWSKYLRFAVVAVGVSTGTRVETFRDYVARIQQGRACGAGDAGILGSGVVPDSGGHRDRADVVAAGLLRDDSHREDDHQAGGAKRNTRGRRAGTQRGRGDQQPQSSINLNQKT